MINKKSVISPVLKQNASKIGVVFYRCAVCLRSQHVGGFTQQTSQELTIVKSLTPHFKFIPFNLSPLSNDAATLQINKVTLMVRVLMKTCCFAQQLNWCVKLYNNLQLNDLKRYSPNDRYGFFCYQQPENTMYLKKNGRQRRRVLLVIESWSFVQSILLILAK